VNSLTSRIAWRKSSSCATPPLSFATANMCAPGIFSRRDVRLDCLRDVGRDVADVYNYAPRPPWRARAVSSINHWPGAPLNQQSFNVAKGEIVGLFDGLVGAGRSELLKLSYGAIPTTGGASASVAADNISTPGIYFAACCLSGGIGKKKGHSPSPVIEIQHRARRNSARIGISH